MVQDLLHSPPTPFGKKSPPLLKSRLEFAAQGLELEAELLS